MAGAVIEVKYFNTFILKKVNKNNKQIWNGSFGIPGGSNGIGGYPTVSSGVGGDYSWAIEESRIRGGYNNTTVDFGAKAYLVEEEPQGTRRFNTLIYSGIFNSRTGINQTNVFSVGEDITKSADPANGSIQKLYAEDTNLNVFQELKVSRALIDKDAIYAAEGGGTVTASNLVIGVIQPYAGKYGISQNPESFAVYGYRKYFADQNNNAILRLSRDGIEEISSYGMKDYFRDRLSNVNSFYNIGKIIGAYDIYNDEYLTSLQSSISSNTLNYDERAKGWVSFFTYSPDQAFSLRNNFYTVKTLGGQAQVNGSVTGSTNLNIDNVQGFIQANSIVTTSGSGIPANTTVISFNAVTGALVLSAAVTLTNNTVLTFSGVAQLWRHYDNNVNRNSFYGQQDRSSITFVFNPNPVNSKTFKTIAYEGSSGWEVSSFESDLTGSNRTFSNTFTSSSDTISRIPSYDAGEYALINTQGTSLAASTNTTVLLNTTTVNGQILAGGEVSGVGVTPGTRVVSYVISSGLLTVNQNLNIALGTTLYFSSAVSQSQYLTVFGTTNPPVQKYYTGFNRKENKYVANLVNNSQAMPDEVHFGEQISGIKGFYATVKLSTDTTTDPGGEKQLFSVESNFIINNGY